MQELLIDLWNSDLKISKETLNESIKQNNGKLILKHVLLTITDTPNSNNRVYPHEYFMREAKLYEENKVKKLNQALLELSHPETRTEFLLEEGCAKIVGLCWENKTLYGDIQVLDYTPKGKILRDYLEDGTILGVSSRSVGSTTISEGFQRVGQDLMLLGWDVVTTPSVSPALFGKSGGYVIKEHQLPKLYESMGYTPEQIATKKLETYICQYLHKCKLGK